MTVVKNESARRLPPLIAGLLYAAVVAAAATLLVSLLLTVTGLKEQSLPVYVYIIHGSAILVGGFVHAKRSGSKGWYRGGTLGLAYALIVVLVSYLGFDAKLTAATLLFVPACLVAGALGGILGINAAK